MAPSKSHLGRASAAAPKPRYILPSNNNNKLSSTTSASASSHHSDDDDGDDVNENGDRDDHEVAQSRRQRQQPQHDDDHDHDAASRRRYPDGVAALSSGSVRSSRDNESREPLDRHTRRNDDQDGDANDAKRGVRHHQQQHHDDHNRLRQSDSSIGSTMSSDLGPAAQRQFDRLSRLYERVVASGASVATASSRRS